MREPRAAEEVRTQGQTIIRHWMTKGPCKCGMKLKMELEQTHIVKVSVDCRCWVLEVITSATSLTERAYWSVTHTLDCMCVYKGSAFSCMCFCDGESHDVRTRRKNSQDLANTVEWHKSRFDCAAVFACAQTALRKGMCGLHSLSSPRLCFSNTSTHCQHSEV